MAGTAAILDEKNGAALEDAQRGDILAQPSKLAASVKYSAPEMAPNPKAKRKEVETPLEAFCSWVVEHQVGLSLNVVALLTLTHICFPRAREHTRKFYQLSYYNPASGQYYAGWDDAWFVLLVITVFTGLRAGIMEYILVPFAKKHGIQTVRNQVRFSEQAWLLIYYLIFWPLGMYILTHSDYWLNMPALWQNWPNREITGLVKFYILVQYGFWLQQIMVIYIEKRRKDHWQMFSHHLITTTLIFTSYTYNQTKVANLVLCTMDIVDIVFPIAKCFKYLGFGKICDYLFGIFMVSWFLCRHVYYNMIAWSLWTDVPREIDQGCYRGGNGNITGPFQPPDSFYHFVEPFFDQTGVVCWYSKVNGLFLGALLFLQGITIIWFFMIIKVAVKVFKGTGAEDIRSDDEGDEEVSHHDKKTEQLDSELRPYEEEVGIEAINLKGRTSKAGKTRYRKGASGNGVSLNGHSDRKELLGRIGCDKGI